MIRKALLLKIFDAAYMQRWNDKIRPVDLIELDKQAHKMVIAYFLGKFEQGEPDLNWIEIIEGGIFELLQRIIITDLKPPIFYKIREAPDKYRKLNQWVYSDLEPIISPLGAPFCQRFKEYFSNIDETLNKRILSAAHFYSTKWEFNIIEWANRNSYEISTIREDLQKKQEKYYDLKGIAELAMYDKYRNFVDLCGQLRFQSRWANLHRIPKTSVLGHSLFVAIASYLLSLEIDACKKRCVNNYFTGLFHDLPEVLTRDIISPVKRSVREIDYLIKEYEKEQMEKEVYSLLPQNWYPEFKMYTENEFESIVTVDGKMKRVRSQEINEKYNEDRFNPRDGELIKAADDLAAFVEAYVAILNGSPSKYFAEAKSSVERRYSGLNIAGVHFGEIYADFEQ
jgi:putative hydrolase of HD superfamily